MNESCTDPYPGGRDDSTGGDVDEVVIQFLKELDGSDNARDVLGRFCEAHPSKVVEFRALRGRPSGPRDERAGRRPRGGEQRAAR